MKNMKKLSLLQKLASLTKSALSPMNPNNMGSTTSSNLIFEKLPSKLNTYVTDRSLADNFDGENLYMPSKYHDRRIDLWVPSLDRFLKRRFAPSFSSYLSNRFPRHGVGYYISNYPPTPAGVPYRPIGHFYDSPGNIAGNVNGYTDVLNRSGLYPEKLSHLDDAAAKRLSEDIAPNSLIYLVEGRDAANWLWNRRGLKLTDEMWDRMNKARLDPTSQLNKIPLNVYYAWSNNDDVSGYSMRFDGDTKKNNLSFNVFNPKYFDDSIWYDTYNGYRNYNLNPDNYLKLEPWERFMRFLDVQDHELSHSLNNVTPTTIWTKDLLEIWDGENKSLKDNMFFRRTNNPELPYYDELTTLRRWNNFYDLFNNTYLKNPSEYIGAMSRVKRYGAELGLDTTSSDPATARTAMTQTLHHLATHPRPEELTPELQRIHSWLNTAAANHMQDYSDDYKNVKKALESNIPKEEKLRLKLNFDANKANYIKDPKSPFYKDVLDFVTDSTIQGLVRNDVPSNNTMALNNLRSVYA